MGVPNSCVTGGKIGNATGGSVVNHLGISGISTSPILRLLILISGIGINNH